MQAVRQFGGHPGLPDARLTTQHDRPPLARHDLLPQLAKAGQVVVASYENTAAPGEERRQRDRGGRRDRFPRHFADRHRLRETFQFLRPQVGERDGGPGAGDGPDQGRAQDLAGAGGGDQPGGLHDRGPEHVAGLYRHLAECQAHPQPEIELGSMGVFVGGLLARDRRRQRLDRRREGGQHTITGVLDLRAAAVSDGLSEPAEVLGAERVEGGVAEPGHQFRRPDQVREQHARHRPRHGRHGRAQPRRRTATESRYAERWAASKAAWKRAVISAWIAFGAYDRRP